LDQQCGLLSSGSPFRLQPRLPLLQPRFQSPEEVCMLIEINGSGRVERGGSWLDYAINCEVTNRSDSYPYNRYNSVGFRVLRRYNNVNKN